MKRYSPNHPAVRYHLDNETPTGDTLAQRTAAVRRRRGLTGSRRIHRNNALIGATIILVAAIIPNLATQFVLVAIGAAIFVPSYAKLWRDN